jgi:hypothetical protein
MDSIDCVKQRIREIIADSRVPEDPRHAENTLKWLFRLEPKADRSLQIAALAHDIECAAPILPIMMPSRPLMHVTEQRFCERY